jgi:hypothetical protein
MTGLPDLDDIAEDDTAAVIIITLAKDGMLDLHVYEADGIEVDTSDVLRCALSLSEDDEVSGKLN